MSSQGQDSKGFQGGEAGRRAMSTGDTMRRRSRRLSHWICQLGVLVIFKGIVSVECG